MGLPGTPKIKFLNKELAKQRKNASYATVAPQRPSREAQGESDESASDGDDDLSEQSLSEEEDEKSTVTKPEKASITYRFSVLILMHSASQPKVRTKYDRMFERKNQNILSEHFNKLVEHEDADDDDDFITLKRANHDLEDKEAREHEYTSKRKQKMEGTKKSLLKHGPRGTKLVFDEEGAAHEVYEMKTAEEVFRDKEEVKEAGRKFAESERSRLKEADVVDKALAKEKKREKKRKRKERERQVRLRDKFVPYVH